MTTTPKKAPFWKSVLALFLPGMLGIATLPIVIIPQLEKLQSTPGAPPIPIPIPLLAVLSLIQPAILLAVFVALGCALAPKLGFHSHLVARARGEVSPQSFRSEIPMALLLGALAGIGIIVLDLAFTPFLGEAWQRSQTGQPRSLGFTILGLLYGGITEELLMRWGLVSLFTWISWRVFQKGEGTPRPVFVWCAILLAAVIFGGGHLPAVAAIAPLTGILVVRTVLLNALGGIIYGWLYWKRSLESAMIAHAGGHVVFTLVSWLM